MPALHVADNKVRACHLLTSLQNVLTAEVPGGIRETKGQVDWSEGGSRRFSSGPFYPSLQAAERSGVQKASGGNQDQYPSHNGYDGTGACKKGAESGN